MSVRGLLVIGIGLAGAGCATYQRISHANLAAFKAGDGASVISYYERNRPARNRQLHRVEAGRLKMLEGDFDGSRREFAGAIDGIMEVQEGPMIRLKDAGGAALTSTFMDDRMAPYHLAAFEIVFAYQQQSLNAILRGDIAAAGVEARRAVYAQDLLADRYEHQTERALRDLSASDLEQGLRAAGQSYAVMGPALGRAKSGFQNPYAWYFSGLLYETAHDPGNAYIAYKKAWELAPDNRFLQNDLLRLAKSRNPEEYRDFRELFGREHTPPDDPASAEVVLFYEEGLISRRHSEKIVVVLSERVHAITLPVYRDGPYNPLDIEARWNNQTIGTPMPLCFVQSLAYHDLKARMPGILARNLTRALTREIAREVTRNDRRAAVRLLGSLAAGIAAAADEADTRGWYSLPMAVQLLRTPVAPGRGVLRLSAGTDRDRRFEIPLDLLPGETLLVWVADLETRAAIGLASLTHPDRSGDFISWTAADGRADRAFLFDGPLFRRESRN